jgi:ParB/RepB/Spo0J family partition protein
VISGQVQFHESLDNLVVPIDAVTPHPANPRNGDIDAIVESIAVNGFIAPVVVQKSTGYIIAGNHRYFALHQMGSEIIPVIYVDVDDTAAKRYLLADNRTSDLGQYDTAQLVELLTEAHETDSLLGTGYNEMDLANLKAIMDSPPNYGDHASWPTLTLTVPPHLKNAFYEVTEHAVSDHERLESLLRMAGWRPSSEED